MHEEPQTFEDASATGSASTSESTNTCSSCGCPTDEVQSTGEASGTQESQNNRRGFLALGAALLASGLSGCGKKTAQQKRSLIHI